ncbi:MAG: 3-phosphoshikimate 1-carboxyvinyltransferase [Desulfoplanes sp.]
MNTLSIDAPASKSMSHRALICAALARGNSTLENVLVSDDLMRTRECLTALGAEFVDDCGTILVRGVSGFACGAGPVDLFVGESGTTCRLLTGLAAAFAGHFRIHGAGRMHERPMNALVDALASLGVGFSFETKKNFLPFVLHSGGKLHGSVAIDISESSQFLSALLLAAPLGPSALTIELLGTKVVSWPYVALTLQMMQDFGVQVVVCSRNKDTWEEVDWRELTEVHPGAIRFVVRPQAYQPRQHRVEADWSNASYFLAAGAIGPAPVCLRGLRPDSMQGDRAWVDILQAMGGTFRWNEQGCTVFPSALHGARLDMKSCPDIVPTVAVMACFAQGPTEIRGVAHLRFKESDRLEAVASQLRRAGQGVEVLDDGLIISPAPFAGGQTIHLSSFSDHRIAMSLSLLACAGLVPAFDDSACVSKSFPGFWDTWKNIQDALPNLASAGFSDC